MKTKLEKVRFIQSECNSPKRQLIRYMDMMEKVDTKRAEALGKIISKLEAWQNK